MGRGSVMVGFLLGGIIWRSFFSILAGHDDYGTLVVAGSILGLIILTSAVAEYRSGAGG